MKKISALINYYNDLALLRLLDESGQLDIYNEIILVDGPYEYLTAHPFLGVTTHYLDDDLWGSEFISRRGINYFKNVWKDEEEKRIKAYDLCTNDIIVLHDTDEFYEFNFDDLDRFYESDKGVGFFACQNLCLSGYHAAKEIVHGIKDFPLKAFIFKKNLINSKEHLDHLWLIGVNQNKKDNSVLYMQPVALGYHFTQMRDQAGQIQKFSFYTSLFANTHPDITKKSTIINLLTKLVIENGLSSEDAQLIYLRGNPAFSGVMRLGDGYITQPRIAFSDGLEALCKVVSDRRYKFKSGMTYKFINGWPCYFVLEKDTTVLRIEPQFCGKVSLMETTITLNAVADTAKRCTPSSLGDYQFTKDNNIAGRLIEIIYRSGEEMLNDYNPIDSLITYA